MATIIYQIRFHSFWHSGAGLSGGVITDNNVIKTADKLPYIPGKTLKGMLRDAALTLKDTGTGFIREEFINAVFGEAGLSQGTQCHFTNACVSEYLKEKLNGKEKMLYQNIASTAINEKGQAVFGSLREMEVTIPMVLYAQIIDFPYKEEFMPQLEYCMKYIKRMGTKRHRGFGRCDWSITR